MGQLTLSEGSMPVTTTTEISPVKDDKPVYAMTVDEYANQINSLWGKRTIDLLNISRLCLSAKKTLLKGQPEELLPKLPFDAATFSKFLKIAKCARLHEWGEKAPAKFSVLYLLA